MKDLYSFDIDEPGLDVSYRKMYEAYHRIFQRLNLNYRVVEADSGAIGGNESHEYMVLAETGEAEIVFCAQGDFAANVEKAACAAAAREPDQAMQDLQKVHTPGQRTIKDLVEFLGQPEDRQAKTLMCFADGQMVAAILRGDRELNTVKLKNYLGCNELVMADDASVRAACGAGFGSLGPVGLEVKVYADLEVAALRNFACGANQDDYHFVNVNPGRDFLPEAYVDLRNAVEGDPCPLCGTPLQTARGIEVGHIFKLGIKYSQAMQATVLDQNGQAVPLIMGCYGIGVSRTMAAAIEQNYDEDGIIWPVPIAPFQVIIVPVNAKKEEQMEAALALYTALQAKGLDVLLDDRDERAGVKFKDADLIGIPVRVTIGPKSLQENLVEVKKRWEKDSAHIAIDQVVDAVAAMVSSR